MCVSILGLCLFNKYRSESVEVIINKGIVWAKEHTSKGSLITTEDDEVEDEGANGGSTPPRSRTQTKRFGTSPQALTQEEKNAILLSAAAKNKKNKRKTKEDTSLAPSSTSTDFKKLEKMFKEVVSINQHQHKHHMT